MRIKNWHKFQHFRDRTPTWIKLHKSILDQRDINVISDGSFRVLIGLWLLASEDPKLEGNLPCDEDIAFRLRISKTLLDKALRELSGFLDRDDINVISKRYQSDILEEEKETEKETEKEETYCPEPSKLAQDQRPAVAHIINCTSGDKFEVTDDDVEKWSKAYPNVDILQTLLEIDVWLDANPTRRKTKSGAKRFLSSWFSREQNKGR